MKRLIRRASIFGFAFILQGCVVYPHSYGAYTGFSPYSDYGYQSYGYTPYVDFSWGGYRGGRHYEGGYGRSGGYRGGRHGRGARGYGGGRHRGGRRGRH